MSLLGWIQFGTFSWQSLLRVTQLGWQHPIRPGQMKSQERASQGMSWVLEGAPWIWQLLCLGRVSMPVTVNQGWYLYTLQNRAYLNYELMTTFAKETGWVWKDKRKAWIGCTALCFSLFSPQASVLEQILGLCQGKILARPACGFGLSLDERVGEEEHQGNDQAVNGQGLHECQGQQQHTSQVICHLRLTGDAINASSGSNALANTGTDRCQANGEASANGRQGRDPHWALVSECCLWCHQSGRGQSCCSSSVCGRGRHMRAARSWHESSQECSAAQQHGTSQDEGASHCHKSKMTQQAIEAGPGELEPSQCTVWMVVLLLLCGWQIVQRNKIWIDLKFSSTHVDVMM